MNNNLNEEVTLLLSLTLEKNSEALSDKEIAYLYKELAQRKRQPADLMNDPAEVLADLSLPFITEQRLDSLLHRGYHLALNLEKWSNLGIWHFTRVQKDKFPQKFSRRLSAYGLFSPAVVFGCGANQDLLGEFKRVSSFDSRLPEALRKYAETIKSGFRLLRVTKDGKESYVGFVLDNLEQKVKDRNAQNLIRSGLLTLISLNSPKFEFRNKSRAEVDIFILSLLQSDSTFEDESVDSQSNKVRSEEQQPVGKIDQARSNKGNSKHEGEEQLALFNTDNSNNASDKKISDDHPAAPKTISGEFSKRFASKTELPYWMALAHIKEWKDKRTNELAKILFDESTLLSEFFSMDSVERERRFGVTQKEDEAIKGLDLQLYFDLCEKLEEEGVEVITLYSPCYPASLNNNLVSGTKKDSRPLILYCAGNTKILNNSCASIVGSREASEEALKFTANVAGRLTAEGSVIASGYAKGVDKQAFDSCIESEGQTIVVLPQGILTFGSEIKKMKSSGVFKNVLVLSVFPPSARWTAGLAMARNKYVYALASEIYVAQSGTKGGTWEGVNEGLGMGRKIYIYASGNSPDDVVKLLVDKGAVPVDINGFEIREKN